MYVHALVALVLDRHFCSDIVDKPRSLAKRLKIIVEDTIQLQMSPPQVFYLIEQTYFLISECHIIVTASKTG